MMIRFNIENKTNFQLLLTFFLEQNYSTANAADIEITSKTPLQKKFQVKINHNFLVDIETIDVMLLIFLSLFLSLYLLACNSESSIRRTTCS